MSERGFQTKSDYNSSNWENSEFPILCSTCIGDSPFVRMIKDPYGAACKMCNRPYTIFKWRPGKGEGYKKTEVCQTCSKIKNICQTCILDLEYGLPSQLRDAVLAEYDGRAVLPESDVNREYYTQQQMIAMSNGDDMWSERDNPNQRLLKMARTVVHDREQNRIKLQPLDPDSNQNTDHSSLNTSHSNQQQHLNQDAALSSQQVNDLNNDIKLLLPPGISHISQLQSTNTSSSSSSSTIAATAAMSFKPASTTLLSSSSANIITTNQTISTSLYPDSDTHHHNHHHHSDNTKEQPSVITDTSNTPSVTHTGTNSTTTKPKPPKPAGPPPPSAFKRKRGLEQEDTNKANNTDDSNNSSNITSMNMSNNIKQSEISTTS